MALKTTADLVAKDAAFMSANELSFELVNRGQVAVTSTIRADVYIDNTLRQTVYLNAVPADTKRHTRVGLSTSFIPGCGSTRNVAIVLDPQNQVAELHDDNNRLEGAAPRRCPDLTVASIRKNMNAYGTEFVAEVRLINNGDAVSPKFGVLATSGNAAIITPLPDFNEDLRGPLAPGETLKFNIGNAFAHQTMHVTVWIDRRAQVAELNESNNMVQKALD